MAATMKKNAMVEANNGLVSAPCTSTFSSYAYVHNKQNAKAKVRFFWPQRRGRVTVPRQAVLSAEDVVDMRQGTTWWRSLVEREVVAKGEAIESQGYVRTRGSCWFAGESKKVWGQREEDELVRRR